MRQKIRKPARVSTTARGLRARNEEHSRMAVRKAEMNGLQDFFDASDREIWEHGARGARGSRRA